MTRRALFRTAPVALSLLLACGPDASHPIRARVDSAGAALAEPPDSLALSAPGGVEVWFTQLRTAADSTGRVCRERVMEIRRAGRRVPVPLLYTGERPTLVDDSTMRAHIWLHCRPGNLYTVSLRSGAPTWVGR